MWKSRYEEFSEALRNGKAIADAEVANALYQRAIGYEHPEEWIGQYKGQPVIVKTIKRYPPDTAAASLWLRNRQPELWREKQEVEHSKGPVTIRVVSGIENSPGSLCRDGMDDENGSATAAPLLGRQGHI